MPFKASPYLAPIYTFDEELNEDYNPALGLYCSAKKK